MKVQAKAVTVYKTPTDRGFGFGPQITAIFQALADMNDPPQKLYVSGAPNDQTILNCEIGQVYTLEQHQAESGKLYYKIYQCPGGATSPPVPPTPYPQTNHEIDFERQAIEEAHNFAKCLAAVRSVISPVISLQESEYVRIAEIIYKAIKIC